MSITSIEVNKFHEDGYVVLEPYAIFNKDEIESMLWQLNQSLPSWKDGVVDPKIVNSRTDTRFSHFYHLTNRIKITGCALRHRITRGQGSIDQSLDENYLYGKRSTLVERGFSMDMYRHLENEKLLDALKLILNTSDLSFHNGSLAAVYPGCVGESRQLHIDTPGFVEDRNKLLDDDKYLVNAMIYLDDVDESLAPMRVVPGSHKKYKEINEALGSAFLRKSSKNNLTQAGDIWEELLPNNLTPAKKIIGSKGTVILMNSSLLHAATENISSNLVRKVLITNYSKYGDGFSKYSYRTDPDGCRRVYEGFVLKNLVDETFRAGMSGIGVASKLKLKLVQYRSTPKYLINKICKAPGRIHAYILSLRNMPKRYLNLGSGCDWRHPLVLSLDYDSKSEISLDLNKIERLPFKDSSLKGVYSSHCLEHLKEATVMHWMKEVLRVLKAGSVFRITVPNIEEYFDAYDKKNASYFDWIRGKGTYRYDSWLRLIVRAFAEPVVDMYTDQEIYSLYEKLGRENFLEFFTKKVDEMQEHSYFLPHTHKSWWSPSKITIALKEAGFTYVKITGQRNSESKIFSALEFNNTRPHMSFYVDAVK